jgi:hypothetical protein
MNRVHISSFYDAQCTKKLPKEQITALYDMQIHASTKVEDPKKAAIWAAASTMSPTHSPINAEHSMYVSAPIVAAVVCPCSRLTGVDLPGPEITALRSVLHPTNNIEPLEKKESA